MTITRREFIKQGAVTLIALSAGTTTICGCKAIRGVTSIPDAPPGSFRFSGGLLILQLEKIPSLASVGGATIIRSALRDSLIVIRSDTAAYHALINKCSHRSKELDYDHSQKMIRCASIGHSVFDLDGRVKKGPAEKNIPSLKTTLQAGELLIDVSGIV